MESDWEARARPIGKVRTYCKTIKNAQTKMLCRDVLQASGAHGTRTKDYLTGPGIKCLEELDDSTHCIRVQHRKIDYEFQIL